MNIEIYTVDYCPYCKKALIFFNEHNLTYKNYDITQNEDEMRKKLGEMFNISGRITVPQIIIDGQHIGGYSDMIELCEKGELKFQ